MIILSIALFAIAVLLIIGGIKTYKQETLNPLVLTAKTKDLKTCIIAGSLFAILGYWAWPGDSKEQPEDIKDKATMAYIMSEDFVKEQLKAPATADFPSGSDGRVEYLGDSVFYVHSYVDAQNTFGANIRTKYAGKIKYAGKDNWINIDISLQE